MAHCNAPLAALAAQGTLARLLAYSNTPSGTVAKQTPRLTKPRSRYQLAIQSAVARLMVAWPTFSDAEKDTWLPLCTTPQQSARSQYLAHNTRHLRALEPITKQYPYTGTGTHPFLRGFAALDHVRGCNLKFTHIGAIPHHALIFRGPDPCPAEWQHVVGLVPIPANNTYHLDYPLPPGTYHYRCLFLYWDFPPDLYSPTQSATAK